MNNEYKITTKTYKEPQQLKNWEDRIVYKSCKTYSKKDYKKTEFYLDDDFKILHCVMEEKTSKKPYLKKTSVSFLSEEWAKKQEENYNKLLENSEYKRYKEKYKKERLEELEEIRKEIRNPFYWIKEFILYTAIYPIIRFINRFKKG